MNAEEKKKLSFKDLLYAFFAVVVVLILMYWKFFRIEFIDSPIDEFANNFPIISGIVCVLIAALFAKISVKKYKEGSDFHLIRLICYLALFGVPLLCMLLLYIYFEYLH